MRLQYLHNLPLLLRTYVSLDGTHERDDFRALLELPRLSDINAYRTITDAESLADIARVPKLQSLLLEAPGEILGQLSAAQELETLNLFGVQIRDADVAVLESYTWPASKNSFNHEQFTYRYGGRVYRLTDVLGNVVREILA